jgi:hypothetical protein
MHWCFSGYWNRNWNNIMSICKSINLGLNLPPLPPIFGGGNLAPTITLGESGLTCCFFEIPAAKISIGVVIPGLGALLQAAIGPIELAINAGIEELDSFQLPLCSL